MTNCGCTSHDGFLTRAGYARVAQRERERPEVDAMETSLYLDLGVSMSALIEPSEPIFVDEILEEQFRRNFHHGP